jgi:DNA-binding transcriptional MerR regulator
VLIRWSGGPSSRHALVRPVQRYEQMADYAQLLKRIDELREEGQTLAEVAEQLNQEGFRPPKRAARFSKSILTHLLWGRESGGAGLQAVRDGGLLGTDEWLLTDLAKQLGMPPVTLHRWIRVGWVHARKRPTPRGHWVIWADSDEQERMTKLRNCSRGWADEPVFEQLTKPKVRDKN